MQIISFTLCPVLLYPAALSASLDEDDMHEVLDVENLLEAYFMQTEGIHSALVNLGEYIDDTEGEWGCQSY